MNPNPSSNKKIVAVIVVLVIIFVGLVVWAMKGATQKPMTTEQAAQNPTAIAPQDKRALILQEVNSNHPLTEAQKADIYKLISGNQLDQYNFSKEEKLQIIKALNQ